MRDIDRSANAWMEAMHYYRCDLQKQWINDYRVAFTRGTHHLIRNISIDFNANEIFVRGDARTYYAAQFAIHTAKTLGSRHHRFPDTALLLRVQDQLLDVCVRQRVDRDTSLCVVRLVKLNLRDTTVAAFRSFNNSISQIHQTN
ncbi:hypothetical protein [Rubripirellula amarantea]|nr:hypothetical protein [Rubripirellula amarantea]